MDGGADAGVSRLRRMEVWLLCAFVPERASTLEQASPLRRGRRRVRRACGCRRWSFVTPRLFGHLSTVVWPAAPRWACMLPRLHRLQYANAGHDLPYVRHADGVSELRATG